ncbi:hypothetical protein MMC06_000438 [Schaereria dolodes]|nr:hypothetical protein [Schaereria dolodes]
MAPTKAPLGCEYIDIKRIQWKNGVPGRLFRGWHYKSVEDLAGLRKDVTDASDANWDESTMSGGDFDADAQETEAEKMRAIDLARLRQPVGNKTFKESNMLHTSQYASSEHSTQNIISGTQQSPRHSHYSQSFEFKHEPNYRGRLQQAVGEVQKIDTTQDVEKSYKLGGNLEAVSDATSKAYPCAETPFDAQHKLLILEEIRSQLELSANSRCHLVLGASLLVGKKPELNRRDDYEKLTKAMEGQLGDVIVKIESKKPDNRTDAQKHLFGLLLLMIISSIIAFILLLWIYSCIVRYIPGYTQNSQRRLNASMARRRARKDRRDRDKLNYETRKRADLDHIPVHSSTYPISRPAEAVVVSKEGSIRTGGSISGKTLVERTTPVEEDEEALRKEMMEFWRPDQSART